MQQHDNFELCLKEKKIEQQILAIMQEIKNGYLVESNDILEDLNPLISELSDSDKKNVIQALNTNFRDCEFVKKGGYWLQVEFNPNKEAIEYKLVYDSDRENNNYESILDSLKLIEYRSQNKIPDEFFDNLEQLKKLKVKSLLVFDLLDYQLDKKDLTQIEILSILLELFYSNTIFTDEESKIFEQLIGSLLQKQLYEISYYFDNLKKEDPQNYKSFVELLQKLQLTTISESDSDLQKFLEFNQRYKGLLMNFSKDMINIRSNLQQFISSLIQNPIEECSFDQIISYISNIDNVNDRLNQLYLQTVFYYWKKYCIQYNLQSELKNQQESLPNLVGNERKYKFIERYIQKQKSNIQDKIYLFVIHKICYFFEEIDNILSKDIYLQFMNTMENNVKTFQQKKQYLIQIILKDKSKFSEFWKITQSLKFYKQENFQQNNYIAHLITNLFWIYNQNVNLYDLVNIMTTVNKTSFSDSVKLIEDKINQMQINCNTNLDIITLKKNFLRILCAQYPKEEHNYIMLKNLLDTYGSLMRASIILEANMYIYNKLDQKSISFFAKIGKKYIVIHKVFPTLTLQKLAYDLFNYLISDNKDMIYECLISLKSIFAIKQIALSEILKSISTLTKNFCTHILGYLIIVNKSQNVSLTSVKWTIFAIFCIFQKIGSYQFQQIEKCIEKLFKSKCYNFPFIFNCLKNKIGFQWIYKIVLLQYYLCNNLENKIFQLSQLLFQQDEQLYEEWFKIQKPIQMMLSIEFLKIKKSQQFYPKQMNIPLEDFNISLSEYCEQDQNQVLENWIQDMKDTKKFKQIIPLFFNIIKRGESPRDVLILANSVLQSYKNRADGIGCFNLKSLFQIFFNNANDELRLILMKFFSKEYAIPFLYQNPILDNLMSKTELLLLNSNLFYFFDQGYTIINLSLSENQKKIGKTELINQIFYERDKFETSDTCQMNSNTIDMMFDFEFNNSRNFIVADVHGKIIFEILIKILPFFKFWIVQMDSLRELQENLDQISKILNQMDQQIKQELEICFIVRNTEDQELMSQQPVIYEIESKKISIVCIHNLAANQIDKQFKISQIQVVSKFLFNLIFDHQNKLELSNLKSQNLKNSFLLILQQFKSQYANNIQQITNHNNLINKIQEQLNLIISQQEGFYSQNAFPIRRILWNIKKLRQQHYELCINPQENKQEIDKKQKQMEELEKNINKQDATDLLRLFCEIFKLNNYYIVYLWIVDKIRQFNEKYLIEFQQKDYEFNEELNKLKQEKHKIKQKHLNDFEKISEDLRNKEIRLEMSRLKKQMDQNAQNISQKNVGIELFWRELISLNKSVNNNLEFDSVETLSQLIRKGESLEFLDGDTLSVNTEFLFELENKMLQNKQQKILVISILGPQSSGKSTILNKIFGCHFWASVGRCTKGIHLQILQVQNKELFQNCFDQILLLDTEGLQNPNQNDTEFDKKIALFVLSISDIIIINVKGEINQQFKNLVEMCIFTLGHLKNGFQMFKQLTWFFNQNDNYKKVEPFRQQIKDLAQKLNSSSNEKYLDQQTEYIDYAEILDIKDNISGLGFASDQKDWGKNGWNQSVNNHTFSREAYKQGINMIKQFISKLQDQKETLNTFNNFLQNVRRNWETIEKLPDLLEFSELIQHQQNLMMKKYFDDLWKTEDATQVGESLILDTIQKIKSQKQTAFDFYKQLKFEKENEIDSIFTQIKTKIEEKMNTFKRDNKIQKKIFLNYLKKLENLIKGEEVDCRLKVKDQIQDYEGEYQQKKGYVQIDNFIQRTLNDQCQKKKYQGDNKAIESEFTKIWESIISENEKQQKEQYLELVYTQYNAIKSISNEYHLNTKNEQEYFNFFRDEIITENPKIIGSNEYEKIFQLFSKELFDTEQFVFINNTKQNLSYLDIFTQKIQEKIVQSKDQLIDMKQFYSQEIIYDVVAKVDIQQYLKNKLEQDFYEIIFKNENQNNVKTHYQNFLSILEQLKITFDSKQKIELDNIIYNPSLWQQAKQFLISKNTQFKETFQELKKSFKFQSNNNLEIDLSGTKISQTFKNIYKGLKMSQITDQSWNNNQKYKQELLQKYIIIDTQNQIKPSQNSFQESFNYIKSQNSIPHNFRTEFPKHFNTIMIGQNIWKKLYNQLYNLIKQEMGYSKQKIEYQPSSNQQVYQSNKEDENISSFNPCIITSIIQKVQNNIKVKYNNQFAQFGVILSDVGERCIYYYSMLILWRFLCYQRWNSKDIQQKHQKNYDSELIRCKAEINQDNEKQSSIKATELVNKIQIQLKNQFLARTKKEVLLQMSQVSMSNVELIAKLDMELLIDVNQENFEDDNFKQKILSYTTDHKSYIFKYTLDLLTSTQVQLLTKYSKKYRKELSEYLTSILENAKIVFNYVETQKKEVKTIKYFNEDANQKNQLFYENYLYRLLIQCLLGNVEDQIDIIDSKYKEIFQVRNFTPGSNLFNINWQLSNPQDQQVYNLKTFVETLIKQIDLILNNIDQISFKQNEYSLDDEFVKLKFKLNGCEYTCPCCKRKCDQENDNFHIHRCKNGHQVRGINGILISNKCPSLYACEEILDGCLLQTLETNQKKTWKEVKKAHSNWIFKEDDEQQIQNVNKWKNVWNMGLGKLVCSHLEKQLNHEVIFSQKLEFEIQVSDTHYILILDDSGSMQGDKWNNSKKEALNFIKQLENIDCAKVSVIIFNSDARIVVECKKPNLNEIGEKISYKGGDTSFDPPFKMALQLIQKKNTFNKIQLLFYTDGEAPYPKSVIEQFCQLPQKIRKLINLIACSGEQSSESLTQLIEKFKENMQSADLKNSVQPMDLSKIWTEFVSQDIHSQLA